MQFDFGSPFSTKSTILTFTLRKPNNVYVPNDTLAVVKHIPEVYEILIKCQPLFTRSPLNCLYFLNILKTYTQYDDDELLVAVLNLKLQKGNLNFSYPLTVSDVGTQLTNNWGLIVNGTLKSQVTLDKDIQVRTEIVIFLILRRMST